MTYPKNTWEVPRHPILASPLTRTLELSVLKSRGTANNSLNHSKEVERYYRVGKVYGSRKKMIHDFCMQFHGKIIHAQVYKSRDWKKLHHGAALNLGFLLQVTLVLWQFDQIYVSYFFLVYISVPRWLCVCFFLISMVSNFQKNTIFCSSLWVQHYIKQTSDVDIFFSIRTIRKIACSIITVENI